MLPSRLMDKTVSVTRPGDDGSGGVVYTTLASGVPAAINSSGRSVPNPAYSTASVSATHTVYLSDPTGATISGGVKVGDRIVYGTSFYEVMGVESWSNSRLSSGGGILYRLSANAVYF